jgi:asparagine synthase (glutamine-hydrolysing)
MSFLIGVEGLYLEGGSTMSVQFGRWNLDGKPMDRDYLEKVKASISPYGPDDCGSYSKINISILYHAFHITKESRRETQPHVTSSGAILTWDGRLDNRTDLIRRLGDVLTIGSTDAEIVAAAYECWRSDSFGMLIGDWALSVWDPNSRSLILAKDPIGTRHIYYSFDNNQVTWSTILDPLVLFADCSFALNEEYIAGWFSFFPATHLTPYVGIYSVPPSSSVLIRPGTQTVGKYWDFDPSMRIRYRTDAEYEEHWRAVFGESVQRRLRSCRPVLAELSGGMDSSSIVCMADTIIARGAAETPRLDTVSYYNDSEPNWNERPYFTKVEEKRGRNGCHIDVASHEQKRLRSNDAHFAATPSSGSRRPSETEKQFIACVSSQGNRVVLSGIGGDEAMGGVPTPTPELEDLLARAQFRTLAHQLKTWALNKRRPWFQLFFEAVRGFLPPALIGMPEHKRSVPWLNPDFVERNRVALQGYERRVKLFGPLPSFQENLRVLDVLRRRLACAAIPEPPYEWCYPYLDRSLLEFIYAIPREQIVRPGQRRSLMRRALVGIVPDELLDRKRKAFVCRSPRTAISTEWTSLVEISHRMVSCSLGLVDSETFSAALNMARQGKNVAMVSLMRTMSVEFWLRRLRERKLLDSATTKRSRQPTTPPEQEHEAGNTGHKRPAEGLQSSFLRAKIPGS